MFDSCEMRIHPTGKAIARFGTKSQGQGHETTYAQIIAEELGIPAAHVQVEEGDTDTAPYGLGTYASRSTPTAGAAGAMAARKVRDKAKKIAAHLLEVSEDDLVWETGKFSVKGAPQKSKTIQEIAFAAYTNHPQGMEAGLEAVDYYDPPNLTFPFGSYICVVDIDRGTGEVKIRRFVAVDDCGNIINPMIVEGQIHGGLTMGMAPALLEEISYDENGNIQGGSFMDYLVPTAMETPKWETGKTVTPSPHHPFGAKGVGESATVGAPPAIVNAVVDALAHLGVQAHRHPDHAGEGLEDPEGEGGGGVAVPREVGSRGSPAWAPRWRSLSAEVPVLRPAALCSGGNRGAPRAPRRGSRGRRRPGLARHGVDERSLAAGAPRGVFGGLDDSFRPPGLGGLARRFRQRPHARCRPLDLAPARAVRRRLPRSRAARAVLSAQSFSLALSWARAISTALR